MFRMCCCLDGSGSRIAVVDTEIGCRDLCPGLVCFREGGLESPDPSTLTRDDSC